MGTWRSAEVENWFSPQDKWRGHHHSILTAGEASERFWKKRPLRWAAPLSICEWAWEVDVSHVCVCWTFFFVIFLCRITRRSPGTSCFCNRTLPKPHLRANTQISTSAHPLLQSKHDIQRANASAPRAYRQHLFFPFAPLLSRNSNAAVAWRGSAAAPQLSACPSASSFLPLVGTWCYYTETRSPEHAAAVRAFFLMPRRGL